MQTVLPLIFVRKNGKTMVTQFLLWAILQLPFFSECTPISANESSLDESPSAETFTEANVKSEPVDQIWTADRENESSTWLDITFPDALLDSDWLEHDSACGKGQVIVNDAMGTLLGDDLGNEYKQMAAGASVSHGWGHSSCSWDSMPTVYQMYELP
ncbi:hypothetical protein OIU77_022441 [Salix suchowensis]|uniref:Uncharacterized protein n=1 Tax=Salix suchowensis TaxID=1278906 RepID=A0ABQ9C086_9ROSI|nr:hypothetical protein OIU77_022441 [Salix suchowensis]